MEALILAIAPLAVMLGGLWLMFRAVPKIFLILLGLVFLMGLSMVRQPAEQIALLLLLGLLLLALLRRRR